MPTVSQLKEAIKELGGEVRASMKKADCLAALNTLPGGEAKLVELNAVKLQTEDLGKITEKALCIALGIPYNGKYKYGEPPAALQARLTALVPLLPTDLVHTAAAGARYDYTSASDPSKHISVKTTKGGSKVAPQCIGQPQPAAFCERIGIPFVSVPALKKTIQDDIATVILPAMAAFTFDCQTVYYNERTGQLQLITLKTPIDWASSSHTYTWTCGHEAWANSASVKISVGGGEPKVLAEFQFHSSSRTNMANRWCFENVLTIFRDNFEIVNIA